MDSYNEVGGIRTLRALGASREEIDRRDGPNRRCHEVILDPNPSDGGACSADPALLQRLISELEAIRLSAYHIETEFEAELSKVTEGARDSARNLLHYMALRRRDLRELQRELASLGLSSLGRSEAHVLGTVELVLGVLHRMAGSEFESGGSDPRPIRFADGSTRREVSAAALFGRFEPSVEDGVHIMVTMPTKAATNYEFVRDLVASGMSCMRINCSQDTREEWAAMIRHLEQARAETGRACRLSMDLAGPKIRVGAIEPGARVLKWHTRRDILGNPVGPATIWITPAEAPQPPPAELGPSATLPLDGATLAQLIPGDKLDFKDARGRARSIRIRLRQDASCLGESHRLTYLSADCLMRVRFEESTRRGRELPADFLPLAIPPREQALKLRSGDTLWLTADTTPARPVARNPEGRLLEEPRVACAMPEIFHWARPGQPILFDDGKIHGVVDSVGPEAMRVNITHPIGRTTRLRSFKGINLPDTDLRLPALTEKDLHDLDFVVEHADIVNMSFVSRPSDVEALQREVFRRTSRRVGVMFKIETRRAFEQLPRILLAAMRSEPVGVMIARGDLAVECGFERLAEVQEEILWLCEAAHVPVVWATQVLDRLTKKGLPTRAEVTDAAMGERAECIMLNKGPHVLETLSVLSNIVRRMRTHYDKKSPTLRALSVSGVADESSG
jgi:pyruvate kinase